MPHRLWFQSKVVGVGICRDVRRKRHIIDRVHVGKCKAQTQYLTKTDMARGNDKGSEGSTYEVVVVGSGIGGLSCAAMLAAYGVKVIVCESHNIPGGAAHAWVKDGYHFESGPSLYSGMASRALNADSRGQAANPIAHVLQAVNEPLDLIEYNSWNVILPEGQFLTEVGNNQFEEVIHHISPSGIKDWQKLQEVMQPLSKAATMLPPAAIRTDSSVMLTAFARYLPSLVKSGGNGLKLLGPFSNIIEFVKDDFVRHWLDLLCFLLSGLPANGTISAEVAFMWAEWYREGSKLEFPRGGSQAIINALVKGIEKHGGSIRLASHVKEIVVGDGKASGVRLRSGEVLHASKAVISNASLNDTVKMLHPDLPVTQQLSKQAEETPLNRSFMHLHLGFDAEGLDDLEMHHIVVNSWEGGVDTEQNVVLISIASVADPSMAPPGKHCLHAYTPATEPFAIWKDLKQGTPEYKRLKEERSQVLWKAVEKIIPDIRSRTKIEMVGTPLTHRHFLRRSEGSYGPGIVAGKGTFPFPPTSLKGLYRCGDSTFPGIGVPAVAASGTIAANSLVSVWDHMRMLKHLGL